MDDHIAAVTTNGASVMVKVGRLINPLQQLCYAYGLQLSIIDVIYKTKEKHSDDDPKESLQSDNLDDTLQANDEENEFLDLDEDIEDINESAWFVWYPGIYHVAFRTH